MRGFYYDSDKYNSKGWENIVLQSTAIVKDYGSVTQSVATLWVCQSCFATSGGDECEFCGRPKGYQGAQ